MTVNLLITDTQQLANLWANYFETLVTPLQDNGIYDQFHKNDIENQVNDIIQNSEDITDCIFNNFTVNNSGNS